MSEELAIRRICSFVVTKLVSMCLTTAAFEPIVVKLCIDNFCLIDAFVPTYTQSYILQLPDILAPGAVVK